MRTTGSVYAQIVLVLLAMTSAGLGQEGSKSYSGNEEDEINARIASLEQEIGKQQNEIGRLRDQLSVLLSSTSSQTTALGSDAFATNAGDGRESHAGAGIDGLLAGTTLTGLMDVYYSYNAHQPLSGISGLRLFDDQTNQFALSLLELGLVKVPTDDNRLGYNLTLGFGNAMNKVNGTDPGGLGFAQYLKEGTASYLTPLGRGLLIDVGKFTTPIGAEAMESQNNWNYSRGLLFDYAAPFYLFGLRAKYSFNDKYALTSYLVNGWNNLVDVYSSGKTGGITFEWRPSGKTSVRETWLVGRGATPADTQRRTFTSTVISYQATAKLSFMANADYGHSTHVLGVTHPVRWSGVAGYARYQFHPLYSLAARYEYYKDPDGFTTSDACSFLTPQNIREVTATVERQVRHHFITRLELRRDVSNRPVFFRAGTPLKDQTTITAGLMYVLEPNH
jgi:Putative beta-barrel porin-2, OmpL-like. bbp2